MNEDFVVRALAVHAAFTSTLWLDMPPSERVEIFEKLIHAYAGGDITPAAFDTLGVSRERQPELSS